MLRKRTESAWPSTGASLVAFSSFDAGAPCDLAEYRMVRRRVLHDLKVIRQIRETAIDSRQKFTLRVDKRPSQKFEG